MFLGIKAFKMLQLIGLKDATNAVALGTYNGYLYNIIHLYKIVSGHPQLFPLREPNQREHGARYKLFSVVTCKNDCILLLAFWALRISLS